MAEETAKAFVELQDFSEFNKAMVAFFAKCLDRFDHCVWLDADIFVHRGSVPWVDAAVERSVKNPEIIFGKPSFAASKHGRKKGPGFSSRYFVYHRGKGLDRLLPLTGIPTDTFEQLFNENV